MAVLLIAGVLGGGAADAGAATVKSDGAYLQFVAAPGESNDVEVTKQQEAGGYLFEDVVPLTASNGTTNEGASECRQQGDAVFCPFGVYALVDLGDGDDRNRFLTPGDGNYWLVRGGAGDDVLRPTAYSGLMGGAGTDTYADTAGNGVLVYFTDHTVPVTVTMDGQPNDGPQGANENVPARVTVYGGQAADTITGDANGNRLHGWYGHDTVLGGAGNDYVGGDDGDDEVDGQAGNDVVSGMAGDDVERGGDGDDAFRAHYAYYGNDDPGADLLDGGPGTDAYDRTGQYPSSPSVVVSLDDRANDGAQGEGDDVRDVEHVVAAELADSLTGSAAPDRLEGRAGDDTLDGLGGADVILAQGGDDVVFARDGAADRIDCGDGADTAVVDSGDEVVGCETVRRDDGPPPASAPGAPAAGPGGPTATGSPSLGPAPARLRSRLDLRVGPARDRRAPYRFRLTGRLRPPAAAGTQACRGGRVTIVIRRGRRSVASRRVALRDRCTFVATVTFRDRGRLGSGRLRVSVRYLGSALLEPAAAAVRRVRAG